MTYQILGQDFHETADLARKHFGNHYGLKSFLCEQEVVKDLSFKPTWQAQDSSGYTVCLDVQSSPFSGTLHEFVTGCASRSLPLKLWVVVPERPANPDFNRQLRTAHQLGVGVIEFPATASPHVIHKPVAFSLFALGKADPKAIPKQYKEQIMSAEETFRDGEPSSACQVVCQELEDLTRKCAGRALVEGWFKNGWAPKKKAFFEKEAWASVLKAFEDNIDDKSVKKKCPDFQTNLIVQARSYTGWRNSVSHKPKTLKELMARDARLRPMFEVTRNLLIEWANVVKPLKL